MTVALAGRGVAMIGIILGLLAVSLDLVSSGGATSRYLDSGAVAVFAIALLSMASYLPAEVGYDTAGTAAGVAVFGFYLTFPAIAAFNHFGMLGAGGWIGLGTVLIPVGRSIVRRAEGGHQAGAQPSAAPAPTLTRDPLCALAVAGLILMAVGIWLPVTSDGPSYWNASGSGHLLGILLLIAVLANAATLLSPLVSGVRVSADRVLLVACASFGLAAALWLETFDHLGRLGSGGWLEAVGGLLLLGGVVAMRLTAGRGARAPQALAATP
jgi:predicted outer membrane lipoprotein